ncbi:DNA-directed DNA polymerase [Candidatus Woesearchaeota archaeon]|nr:DNA-directed DNA polymerase [Candidatus Woesearchaeota archaeon]
METIQFHPLDFVYKARKDEAAIYIYGKTTDGKSICVVDNSFLPYFYVRPIKTADTLVLRKEIEVLRLALKEGEASVVKTEIVEKQLLNEKVSLIKVYTKLPTHVYSIKKEIEGHPGVENCYEYDVSFVNHYLMDSGLVPLTTVKAEGEFVQEKSRVPVFLAEKIEQVSSDSYKNYRILAFDIETYNPFGKRVLPEEHPIVMLGLHGKNFRKVITWKRFKTDLDYIEFVDGEIALLERFKEIIEQYAPDILTGYFSDGFDLPYIISRAKKYKIDLDLGLDYSKVLMDKRGEKKPRITGLVHLDVFKFIRRTMATSLETDVYTLDAVGSELLGEQKKEVDLNKLAHDWDNHPENLEKYCEYNLHDAYLTFNLCEKILPNLEEFVKIVRLPLFEVCRMSFSKLVESYIMSQAKNFNVLVPNKPGYNEIRERKTHTYKGGFVFEPQPGLYSDVVVFDFRSLYPTIISSHNISGASLECSCCESSKVPNENYWFCVRKKSFLPTILEALITRRMRVKEIIKEQEKPSQMLRARSEALKILANAFYGYYGFFAARWYCIECARSITAYARNYIQSVIGKAQGENFDVLYSDTDSVFLVLGEKTKEDALDFMESINTNLPGLMELEYEGFYPYGLFVSAKAGPYGAKKKYALLSEKGNLVITGFETVRRNWSLIAKETQEKVLNIILKERDVKKAYLFVRSVINDLRAHKVPNEKVIINTQLQKDISGYDAVGPHVAVAKRMEAKGYDVGPGSLIQWVVTEGKGIIRERAKLPEVVAEGEYDEDYYINNQVIPAVERIFDVLGYTKESLVESKEQSKLGEFFG